jgi:phosphonate transport system substrate-binding protein
MEVNMIHSDPAPRAATSTRTADGNLPSARAPRGPRTRPLNHLRVANCLAPHLGWFYRDVGRLLGSRLGLRVKFRDNAAYDRLGDIDLAFVCSLAYIEHPAIAARFEPLAAPVLAGARYRGEPIYYSDVIVQRNSSLRSFADLRGRSWAYNEVLSQSGYGITRYHLALAGETCSYFGRLVEAGHHDRAIHMVAAGHVDAAAIDSHVLESYLRLHPELASSLRVIDCLGPSPIQPVLIRRNLPAQTKEDLGAALVQLNATPGAHDTLAGALIERFVRMDDAAYNPVRCMRAIAGCGQGARQQATP